MKRPLSSMAQDVLARMHRNRCSLYVQEIGDPVGLDREATLDALHELEDRRLVEPVQWRIVDGGARA